MCTRVKAKEESLECSGEKERDKGLDSGGEAQGIDMDYGPARASQSYS